jgi:heat shock protein HslJ
MITKRIFTVTVLAATIVACSRRPTSETATEAATVNATAVQLRSTYWKLIALGTTPVNVADSQREPHIIIQPDSKRVNGSGGCNRMFGSYELNGDALAFTGVASTKMACQDGMDIETSFLPALQRVARWRITGQQLELLDASGGVVAKFEAKKPA